MLLLKYKKISALFILFALVYVLQVLVVTPTKTSLAKYHVSPASAKAIGLTVVIPYVVIWFIAFVGYLRLHTYARTIAKSKDGEAFATIAKGIMWLVLWLPLSTLLSGFIAQYYGNHPAATADLVRLNQYASLLLTIPGFWYVYTGSLKLLNLLPKQRPLVYQHLMLVYIAFSAIYVFFSLEDTARNHSTHDVTVSTYYLPDWMIMTTLLIPRLIFWFLAAQAVQNILLYRQKVRGALYKAALRNLAYGLGWVVGSYVVLRIIQSLSGLLGKLNLALLLLLVYFLLILIAIGYFFVARGARKLQKIEEL